MRHSPFPLVLAALVSLAGPLLAATGPDSQLPIQFIDPKDRVATPPPATAPAKAVTYGYEADFSSKYVFRGIEASEGPVFEPSVWVSRGPAKFTVWANMPLNGEPHQGRFNEVDLILGYSHESKGLKIEPSFDLYTYPDTGVRTTGEAVVKVSKTVGPIDLYMLHNLDVIAFGGAYSGEVGIEHERELTPKWSLAAAASLGWGSTKFNRAYLSTHKGALNVASGQLSWTYSGKNGFYARPHLGLTALLDKRLRDAVRHPTMLVGGVAFGREF